MNELLRLLDRNQRRGSKPRCHFLTHGPREVVAARLTQIADSLAIVTAYDHWLPLGFECRDEAQLDKNAWLIPYETVRAELASWWLESYRLSGYADKTPTWDIASTCWIENRPGMLLMEAKAHEAELNLETRGKSPDESPLNHESIGRAIGTARMGLARATGKQWRISRDKCYQLSNRFAWAWKLTELGFPVVLVYLGFLQAVEMRGRGKPFTDLVDWADLVRVHSKPLFPFAVWGQRCTCNGQPFIPLIKAVEQPLECEV